MSTPLRLTAAVLLCLPLPALGAGGAKVTFEVLSLPDEGTAFAIHPERGTLAVLGSNGREVVPYPDLVTKRKLAKKKEEETR